MSRAAITTSSRVLLDEPVVSRFVGDLAAHLGTHGMYPPNEGYRLGAAAFTVRADLTVGDVLESVAMLMRQVDGIFSPLACDGDANTLALGAAEAASHLIKQARGLHSMVFPVLVSLRAALRLPELLALVPEAPCEGQVLTAEEAAGLEALRVLLGGKDVQQ